MAQRWVGSYAEAPPTARAMPASRHALTQRITEAGAVAVLRLDDPAAMPRVIEALVAGGVTGIEITMTVPHALRLLRETALAFGERIVLGVGSVLDAETAHAAAEAGARFVVSPVMKPEIIEAAHAEGVPAMVGAFSPTEIQAAHERGADVVKVFPADVLGMAFFRAVLAPMPHLRLMPTGGVTLTNAGEWLRAGACAVGVGGALLDREAIAEGRFEAITERARTITESIRSAR